MLRIAKKLDEILGAFIALAGLANMGLVITLPTFPDFSFNNFLGAIFFLSIINSIAVGKLVLILNKEKS